MKGKPNSGLPAGRRPHRLQHSRRGTIAETEGPLTVSSGEGGSRCGSAGKRALDCSAQEGGRDRLYDQQKDGERAVMTANGRASERDIDVDDPRIARAVFTLREAAAYLGLPNSTLHSWARPSGVAKPVITCFPARGREATVPFIGFAEAYVLSAFRRVGVPMQRIRPAVEVLSSGIGVEHALASKRLYTDGAEVLYDYATSEHDEELRGLTVVRTGQRQFAEIVRDYLRRITYGGDGWASRLRLPAYRRAEVIVDPRRAFGMPLVISGGARVEDLVDRFIAGDTLAEIADDFGVSEIEVEDVVRVATKAAA